MKASVDAARKLNLLAGRMIVVLGVVHLLLSTGFAVRAGYPSGWLQGDLRSLNLFEAFETTPSHASFFGSIGGVSIPFLLTGALVVTLAKAGLVVPRYVGYGTGVWLVILTLILEPSGFPLGLVAAALLIRAHRLELSQEAAAATSPRGSADQLKH
jgi:hypothetical protein